MDYGLGLNKQVGTKNPCLDSKICPYGLIFRPQVEENEYDIIYFCYIYFFLLSENEFHRFVISMTSMATFLKILLLQIVWTKIFLSRIRIYHIFPLYLTIVCPQQTGRLWCLSRNFNGIRVPDHFKTI